MPNHKGKRSGFTLIELVVVVAIIGILTTVSVLRFQDMTREAARAAFEANHRAIISALTLYSVDHAGMLPPNGQLPREECGDSSSEYSARQTLPADLAPYLPAIGDGSGLNANPEGAIYYWMNEGYSIELVPKPDGELWSYYPDYSGGKGPQGRWLHYDTNETKMLGASRVPFGN
ncbi:MAG: type II secretion system GspH family protein [Clostridiales bacterium]|jgi:prepilin-type N-terminal cleavage/methylation domain-containing protein|nr:type II secretion system GspH family protein [Clostridiales bacterium]